MMDPETARLKAYFDDYYDQFIDGHMDENFTNTNIDHYISTLFSRMESDKPPLPPATVATECVISIANEKDDSHNCNNKIIIELLSSFYLQTRRDQQEVEICVYFEKTNAEQWQRVFTATATLEKKGRYNMKAFSRKELKKRLKDQPGYKVNQKDKFYLVIGQFKFVLVSKQRDKVPKWHNLIVVSNREVVSSEYSFTNFTNKALIPEFNFAKVNDQLSFH
ncbi:predicted protein [Naegleria gruberi]|uniref:Predicted protein n=1 Tax=Naegleria gruberi TaxID=5762 RepID=D2VJR2_NAEGR|nr:uncharacterized protein NAEGRDRAFT_50113 [Naegleria gruberi]EFC42995.1 predicted protein [Naegleria gruberi]|eukprot:XP_002675739.1 predicted protein [Naegleria gruberi strain NEG-M]